MSLISLLKRKASIVANTPLHPQWLHRPNSDHYKSLIATIGEGKSVLDIGCYNKWAKRYLPARCAYVGLDYYETATQWYKSVPDIYGDALQLPIAPESFDTVIMIDVLEHINATGPLLEQIYRVLKPEGVAIIALPFLYPVHDAPRDFVRFTHYGIQDMANRCGFHVDLCDALGTPLVTSAFLTNVALTKTALNWFSKRSLYSVIALLFPPIILMNNLTAKLLSRIEIEDNFMANSYQLIIRKKARDSADPQHHN
ncbi:MAG: class I SAM-dependent methyltransferase [Halioglobus sp.]|nr:class I SAM-dependent methyltransferase [Halioglobus sp.]